MANELSEKDGRIKHFQNWHETMTKKILFENIMKNLFLIHLEDSEAT